ncbi:MAG TPA: carboxylesterase family protein [Streptosporangiaceae bacterium]|nr:carboxylesterase family protein [Streptosporangiaceae bacterium]
MRAIPARQRVRTGLARGAAAAAVLITAAACTNATANTSPTSSPSRSSGTSGTDGTNATGASAAGSGGLVVATADGAVRGKAVAATDEYLGIPYAAPPVGALRWQPPKPPASWHGVRSAASFAPHCPQPSSAFGVASTSEDCLYLNVFTPAGTQGIQGARDLPVMVWVHGGSLRTGASEFYNPTGLVGHGVIVVTINYRLGALGFLADSALASRPGGPSGNYGLMDQQAALRWVQRNIRGFGGNPRNVTLFGESAGGLSTLSQLVSPGARGLFQRAIVESGSYNPKQQALATAEAAGQAFATKAGCASNTASCLRALPVSTILANEDPVGYTPDVDGVVLRQSVKTALASGQFNRVPVMTGTNHDEYRLFVAIFALIGAKVTAANYQNMIANTLNVSAAAAATIAARYPLSHFSSPSVALGAVGTDAIFACHALSFDESLSRYVPTYAYEFNDENAPELFLPPVGFPYGAAHASELQYLFSQTAVPYPAELTAAQQQLAAAMKQDWTTMAKVGVPAAGWPQFTSASQRMLSLVPPRPQVETNFSAQHQCSFWTTAEANR